MLMKITPSSANSFCSSFNRGYIMHSHLSWRVKILTLFADNLAQPLL